MDLSKKLKCSVCEIEREIYELNQCSNCRPLNKPRPYFCDRHCSDDSCGHALNCTNDDHFTCWDAHLPRITSQARSHTKVDGFSNLYVDFVTYSAENHEDQARLHEKDRESKWFLVSNSQDRPTIGITKRFHQLCPIGNRSSSRQYPSFVSFIGDTGVGKSTLIKAMISMGRIEANFLDRWSRSSNSSSSVASSRNDVRLLESALDHTGPVTRTADPQHLIDPTTSGVHLYRDPTNSNKQYSDGRVPLLFADCEGFRGEIDITNSERPPVSDTVLRPSREIQPRVRRSSSPRLHRHEKRLDSSLYVDEINITSSEYRGKGKLGTELLYARFLYAFSDVVVFVTDKDQFIRGDMKRLLEWGALAVNSSINNRPQKTLVVVRNMPQRHDKRFYDAAYLQEVLLGGIERNLWEDSEILADFKKEYDRRSKLSSECIYSNAQLFNALFQHVKVCYIPHKNQTGPDEVFNQYRYLRRLVVQAANTAQTTREESWTRYDVPTLTHLLQRAFEHFATQKTPFDFYVAARKDNPTPISMSEHIANFIRHMQDKNAAPEEIPTIISACCVAYAERNLSHAFDPHHIFTNSLEAICRDGIVHYQSQFQRCDYEFKDGGRCVAFALTHQEHTDSKGNRVAGNFDPSGYAINEHWCIQQIESLFRRDFRLLYLDAAGAPNRPCATDVAKFRKDLLATENIKHLQIWRGLKSNKTCLACLQSVPDHVLSCGHSYCETCVKDFGEPSKDYECAFDMYQCVLCRLSFRDGFHQVARLKPRCAGIRVLTLDGGGVRGIVELAILEKLYHRIGLEVPIRDLFDLVMGTSTGGIISLGLALTKFSVEEMKERFQELATKTFQKSRSGILSSVDVFDLAAKVLMVFQLYKSYYKTKPLKEGLLDLFGQNQAMFSYASQTRPQRSARVAVTSSLDGHPCIISNYNRPPVAHNLNDLSRVATAASFQMDTSTSNSPGFEREDDPGKEIKVWEAALATSAAPYYFKPFRRSTSDNEIKVFYDGALEANLPISFALKEIKLLWPSTYGVRTKLDTLVSVGTGIQKKEISLPPIARIGGFDAVCRTFFNTIDTESSWLTFRQEHRDSNLLQHIHRLNVPLDEPYVGLDHYKEMERLTRLVDRQYDSASSAFRAEVSNVADLLTAALLFFEPDADDHVQVIKYLQPPGSLHKIRGTIRCRLSKHSDGLASLTRNIEGIYHCETTRDNQIPDSSMPWRPISFTNVDRDAIRGGGRWFRIPCHFETENHNSTHTVAVRLYLRRNDRNRNEAPKISEYLPISGFPVRLAELEAKANGRWDARDEAETPI